MQNKSNKEKTLYVDPKDQYEHERNAISIHPSKIYWIQKFQKETFDKAIIKNVELSYLKAINLFRLAQAVKKSGIVEIYVHQPISVMQSMDAAEVEANAKLAGFTDVKSTNYENWTKQGDKDVKFSTVKITLIVSEKMNYTGTDKE